MRAPLDLEAWIREVVREELGKLPQTAPAAPADGEVLLDRRAVAKLLGCSLAAFEERLARARRRGEPHPLEAMVVKIDGSRRWRRRDVIAYVNALAEAARR